MASVPAAQARTASPLLAKWPTLFAAAFATFLVPLDVTITAVALPAIERDLGASFSELQWIVNAYNIAYTAVLMAVGALADRFGRRFVFTAGLAIFGLTSLLVGLADSPLALIIGRLAQGLGAGAMLIVAVAILSHAFQGPERAKAFGIWGVFIGVGAAFGPMLGGLIVDLVDWRWIFLINVPAVALLIAVTWWGVEESADSNAGHLDWPGLSSFTAAIALFSFGIIQGGEMGWTSALVAGSLIASLALFVLFVAIERRVARPMFELTLFRVPTFTGAQILGATKSLSFWVMLVYFPVYFQVMDGMSASGAGAMLMPLTIPLLFLPPLGARLAAGAFGVRGLLTLGSALIAAGFIWLAVVTLSDITGWLATFLVIGVGAGLINGEMSNVATAVVPSERSGMASGINMTFRHGFFTLAIALVGAILVTGVGLRLAETPGLAASLGAALPEAANKVALGDFAGAVASAPDGARAVLAEAGRASFAATFDVVLALVALFALVSVVASAVLIRRGDLDVAEAASRQTGSRVAAVPAE